MKEYTRLDKRECFGGRRFGVNVLVVNSDCGTVGRSILLIWGRILW